MDGFGSQYQALMSGIAYCNYKNYEYIHTPLKTVEHTKNVKSLNNFIGMPYNNNNNNIINIKQKSQEKFTGQIILINIILKKF